MGVQSHASLPIMQNPHNSVNLPWYQLCRPAPPLQTIQQHGHPTTTFCHLCPTASPPTTLTHTPPRPSATPLPITCPSRTPTPHHHPMSHLCPPPAHPHPRHPTTTTTLCYISASPPAHPQHRHPTNTLCHSAAPHPPHPQSTPPHYPATLSLSPRSSPVWE